MPLNKLLLYPEDNFVQAGEAVDHLAISVGRCNFFIPGRSLTEEQLINLETLTGRFARLSDILIQKILKTIDRLDAGTPGTVRDRILEAERKGIIGDINHFLEIRDVRNTIDEYESRDFDGLITFVLQNTAALIETVKNAKNYSQKFYPQPNDSY